MEIVAIFFKDGTEKDAAFVYVAIMDCIVIIVVVKTIVKVFRKSS
jgi:hypothetical protein